MTTQSEAALEQGLIKALQDMSYKYVKISEETNLHANFKAQLEKHNRKELAKFGREHFTDSEFDRILIYLEGGTRFDKAKKLRDLYPLDTEDGNRIWVEFLNRQQWCQNEFQVSNQITVEGRKKCRYDVTILINGLPLVQIELKRRGVELKQAYNQIQRYHKTSFHGLFDYIQIFVISNGVNTRYFANNPNQGYKFTFNWSDKQNNPFNDLSLFAAMFFDRCTLGKMISKYIVLHEGDKCLMVLRPYQFYAVEEILDRVQNTNKNGYIWHTTGAGKTLTSFKAAQLVSEVEDVDKVMFVVDRHDLDTQTQSEYEAFEPGAVDSTDSTYELIKRLSSNSKIIITTIQKLNVAVTRDRYNKKIQDVKNQRIVMIFDECHRSHFGESHKNIVGFFENSQCFGFTGTPIFAENAVNQHTTKEIFGECLHKYLIKDAIADENVLGFLVEYYTGNLDMNFEAEGRMTKVAQFILKNFNISTLDGEFDAIFAVQSVKQLVLYYKIFKSLNPSISIGAVFTYQQNTDQEDDNTGMNSGFADEKVDADELQAIMDDYNAMYGTQYSTENFSAYYDDINRRMKKKDPAMKPLDLLLVVGMFLTGFDSKKLNTLYVDKNMEYHGLLQAFSRTNRVLNEKKRFGKIVCFRDLKEKVDASIKLFSSTTNPEDLGTIVRPPFEIVMQEYNDLVEQFKTNYPTVQGVDFLQNENDKRDFILAFREILKKHAEMQVYNEFDENSEQLAMPEQEFMDYRSKYLDMALGNTNPDDTLTAAEPEEPYGEQQTIEDIDFCLELLHSDIINVAYILQLIADLNPSSDDYLERRRHIIDTMIKDAEMRNKAKLIDGFIQQNVDNDRDGFERAKADGTMDLESRLNIYVKQERAKAIEQLAQSEGVPVEVLDRFLSEYDYLQKQKPEIIQEAVREQHLGLSKTRKAVKRILAALTNIINIFNWD